MVHALWIQAGKKDCRYIGCPPKGHWNKTILPASVPGARTRSKIGLMSSAVSASQAPTKAIKMNETRNRKEYGFRNASNRWTWVITQRPSADQARRVPRIDKSSPYGGASQGKSPRCCNPSVSGTALGHRGHVNEPLLQQMAEAG